jgi:hypothetical protein
MVLKVRHIFFRSEGYEAFSPVVNTVLTASSPGGSILVFASPSFCSLKHWVFRVTDRVVPNFIFWGHANVELFLRQLERKAY